MSSIAADADRTQLRWGVYSLLVAIAVGGMLGRIMAVNAVDRAGIEKVVIERELANQRKKLAEAGLDPEQVKQRIAELEPEIRKRLAQQRPFLSANDRSRWNTVRSLVEHGTYAIDDIIEEPNWDTIDMVRHDQWNEGEYHLYSSKPPLLATLVAAPYWLIHRVTGWTLGSHPYEIGRAMLVFINVLPLVVYFVLLARFAERFGRTDWGQIFMVAAACFGTFLTTFAVVLNNHLPAAVSAAIALHCGWRVFYDGERRWHYFAIAGFFAAFAAANELPALSLFGLLTLGMLWVAPGKTVAAYVPAAVVVAAAFFGTNYLAHNTWKPPYSTFGESEDGENWYDYEYVRKRDGRVIQSYWRSPSGIDKGEESQGTYVFHALIGHHGILSLTPIWMLSLFGLALMFRREYDLRWLSLFIIVLTVVCVTFYLMRPVGQRNYGGMTSGFRWVFWFAPLWLIALLPAADYLSTRRWKRGLALALLALSIMSATYPTWNPWTHPWLMNLMLHLEWVTL